MTLPNDALAHRNGEKSFMASVSPASDSQRSEFTRTSVMAAIGAWFGFLVGPNAMISSTNSNFLAVLPDALRVGPGQLTTALAFSVWIVAILAPISGRMMDRFGVRRIIIPGAVLLGVTYLLMSQMTRYWQFFALELLLSVPASMHCSVGYAKIVSSWFDRHRGAVLGLCVALGAGVGQTLMPKLSDYLIRTYGWRGGYMGISAIVLLLGLPAIALLARTPARKAEAARDSGPAPLLEGVTRAEALRTPAFYLVFFAIMFGSMSLLGTLQVAKPMLLERGLANGLAVTVSSFAFAGVILGEFSSGLLVDRLNTPRVVLPYFVAAFVGLIMVHTVVDPALLCAGGLLMGLGLGGEIGQNAYLISRYFGLRNFGAIYGLTFAASNLGIGVGVMAMGWV